MTRGKSKYIDGFGDVNWINLSNFNAMTRELAEIFEHPFSHLFIFGNIFPVDYCFFAVTVISSKKFASLH